jgi:HPt (histidine-containing phosphotransfer) domain-containing protein
VGLNTVTDPLRGNRPVLDVNVLRTLLGDDADTVRDVLREYQQSLAGMADGLRAGFMAGDLKQVAAVAHKLKSASRTVGALQLGELCGELERPTSSATVIEQSQAFEQALAATQAALDRFLGGEAA